MQNGIRPDNIRRDTLQPSGPIHPISGPSALDANEDRHARGISWPARLKYLAAVDADGDVPTLHDTRLGSDIAEHTGLPWEAAFIRVSVHYVSPVSPDDTVYLIVDGADGRGRALVIADGQDHAEAESWMYGQTVTLAGRRTELFGHVGLDIRRTPATAEAVAA